jgi:hypothetical protein
MTTSIRYTRTHINDRTENEHVMNAKRNAYSKNVTLNVHVDVSSHKIANSLASLYYKIANSLASFY